MSSDIKLDVRLEDTPVSGTLGVELAYQAGVAHILAKGFHPSDNGARALGEMLRDLGDAVLAELGGQHEHRVRANPVSTSDKPKARAFNPQPR